VAGQFTPSVYEGLTRLAAWMPFGRAASEARHFLHVSVTEATVRRHSEAAGAAYVAVQTRAVEQLEREGCPALGGAAKQFISVDGAFVPLVGGEWAEAKTLAIGTVEAPRQVSGETVIQTGELSYFSRLTDATTFQRLALAETQRRGLDSADSVGAVTDGSEWCQGFVDFHRPDAVRILDFPHAAEYVAAIGQAAVAENTTGARAWLSEQLHSLKRDGPGPVLSVARQLAVAHPDHVELAQALTYLTKRELQLDYPAFQAAGWPIGDGAVESANKLVVEARLKGSGMHWARPHVNPMLALRNIACNDRWPEAWPQLTHELRRQAAQRRVDARANRHLPQPSLGPQSTAPFLPLTDPPAPSNPIQPALQLPETPPHTPDQPKTLYRPPATHPWRRPFLLKTKRQCAQPKPT